MAKHNKKRNVGLIHEQLVRYASACVIEGDKNNADCAVKILDKNFKEGTALHREFRLFNALVHTSVPNKEIARKIIEESKRASKAHSETDLNTEKSHLIRDINHQINEGNFYSKRIPEYKIFATVQALLNEWRGAQKLGPDEVVKYEDVLERWLTREAPSGNLDKHHDANPLTLKIMTEKFNKKYSKHLNHDQVQLLEAYLAKDKKVIKRHISTIKNKAKKAINNFYAFCDNEVLQGKRILVESKIDEITANATDTTITRALMVSELINEMELDNEI